MPINPPGFFRVGSDVMMTEIELANWEGEGGQEFRPRPRVRVPEKIRKRRIQAAEEEENDGPDCD